MSDMSENRWARMIGKLLDETGASVLAESSGVSRGTLYRWAAGNVPDPAAIITFARNIGYPPVGALEVAGYLSPPEADASEGLDITKIPDAALLDEINRRFNR